MKIRCTRQNLLNALNIVSKAVSTKTALPILECILIDVYADSIKLTANDLELGIETVLEGEVLSMGRIAIEAKIFTDIVKKLPDSDVTLETTEDMITTIRCEKLKYDIPCKSGIDFTDLPEIEKTKSITISQFSLREIIRQTIFSISNNENNKIMTGELFEVVDGNLRVVSLDGHRISLRKIALKESTANVKVVVPGKTLNELSKIISGGIDDQVKIYFTERHMLFEFDKTVMVTRLIEGDFFKIDNMINIESNTQFTANSKEFYECIDRASLLIKESDNKPIVVSVMDDNNMYIQSNTLMGKMKGEMEVKKTGSEITIGLNPKFMLDALRVIDDEEITMYMRDPKSPCIIKDADGNYVYVVMPININAEAY